jgi:NADPH-dependent 7-cyano-7-deazaguanine reductase QueF-like protein
MGPFLPSDELVIILWPQKKRSFLFYLRKTFHFDDLGFKHKNLLFYGKDIKNTHTLLFLSLVEIKAS